MSFGNELPALPGSSQPQTDSGGTSNVIPMSVTVSVRKIPFSLKHKGKSKNFSFAETKTVGELYQEIGRLRGTCIAAFTTPFPADVSTVVVLKTLSLPSANDIVLLCSDNECHQHFNSEMLVSSVSTQEQLNGLKEKYSQLLEEKNDAFGTGELSLVLIVPMLIKSNENHVLKSITLLKKSPCDRRREEIKKCVR